MTKAIPTDRLFSEEHEWVKIEGNDAFMGISDYAQSALGDVVYVELPDVGSSIKKGVPMGVVESVKAVSDIFAPLSGTVKAINQAVIDRPELINQDPYQNGWLIIIELAKTDEDHGLLSPNDYQSKLLREAK